MTTSPDTLATFRQSIYETNPTAAQINDLLDAVAHNDSFYEAVDGLIYKGKPRPQGKVDAVIAFGAHRMNEKGYADMRRALEEAAALEAKAYIFTGGCTLVDWAKQPADPVSTEARLMWNHVLQNVPNASALHVFDTPAWLQNPGRYDKDISRDVLPEELRQPDDAEVQINTLAGTIAQYWQNLRKPIVLLENRSLHTGANADNILKLFPAVGGVKEIAIETSAEHCIRAEMAFNAGRRKAGIGGKVPAYSFVPYDTENTIAWRKRDVKGKDLVKQHGTVLGEITRGIEYFLKGDIDWGRYAPQFLGILETATHAARRMADANPTSEDSQKRAIFGEVTLERCRARVEELAETLPTPRRRSNLIIGGVVALAAGATALFAASEGVRSYIQTVWQPAVSRTDVQPVVVPATTAPVCQTVLVEAGTLHDNAIELRRGDRVQTMHRTIHMHDTTPHALGGMVADEADMAGLSEAERDMVEDYVDAVRGRFVPATIERELCR